MNNYESFMGLFYHDLNNTLIIAISFKNPTKCENSRRLHHAYQFKVKNFTLYLDQALTSTFSLDY
jgi:hypothetical protein